MQHCVGHAYTKTLVIAYLKFRFKWHLVFYLATLCLEDVQENTCQIRSWICGKIFQLSQDSLSHRLSSYLPIRGFLPHYWLFSYCGGGFWA